MKRIFALMAVLFLVSNVRALPANFERKDWVAGLNSPMAMKWTPDGRLFVLEQAGHVRVIKGGVLLPTKYATVKAWTGHRESMLGVAFDPKFALNGFVYLYYSENGVQKNRITRITSSKANPDVSEPGSEVVLLDGIGTAGFQGGAFFFGKDGMLYAASAHGGSQNLNDLGGKVLRLNATGYPSVIPADNPFVGRAGARPEVWAYGFREPFTGAADTVTGNMVVNDVGDVTAEEVNLLKKGANYGFEGGCEGTCTKAGMENPWITYGRSVGICITGAAFYYGASFPSEYRGSYFYADWSKGWIKRRDAAGRITDFDADGTRVIQMDVGPDGSLYLLKINGGESIPWTGSIQKATYTGMVGTLPYRTVLGDKKLGPEISTIKAGTRTAIRFFLGETAGKDATLSIHDSHGRLLAESAGGPQSADLVWNFGARAPRSGVYFYSLRTASPDGSRRLDTGRLLFLD